MTGMDGPGGALTCSPGPRLWWSDRGRGWERSWGRPFRRRQAPTVKGCRTQKRAAVQWGSHSPRTRGAGARRQGERDAGRGGGWAAEGPRLRSPQWRQGRHFHPLLLWLQFAFPLSAPISIPKALDYLLPQLSEGLKVSFLRPSDLRPSSVPEGCRFSGIRPPPWPCPRPPDSSPLQGRCSALTRGSPGGQLQTASLSLKASPPLPSSPRSPPDRQISFPFNKQSLPIFFKKPFPQGVMFFYLL